MKKLLALALIGLAVESYANPLPVASLASPLDDSGASAMFFNPAGLAWLKQPEIALHHNTWLAPRRREA